MSETAKKIESAMLEAIGNPSSGAIVDALPVLVAAAVSVVEPKKAAKDGAA